MEALTAFQVLVNTLSVKSKAEISTMYPYGKIHFIHIAYYFQVIVHILFVYIYATLPVSSLSTSSSLNAEQQSGTPSTSTMENNLQASYIAGIISSLTNTNLANYNYTAFNISFLIL